MSHNPHSLDAIKLEREARETIIGNCRHCGAPHGRVILCSYCGQFVVSDHQGRAALEYFASVSRRGRAGEQSLLTRLRPAGMIERASRAN